MKFLRSNIIALILVISTIMSEYFHLLFAGLPFNGNVNLDAPIYYLIFAFGGTTLITSLIIFGMTSKEKIASRAILFGLVIWNIIEVYENYCYLAGFNNNVLIISGGSWGQLVFIFSVVFLSGYGFSKLKS